MSFSTTPITYLDEIYEGITVKHQGWLQNTQYITYGMRHLKADVER